MTALRPGFGPTLPALLRRRLGVPVFATVGVAVVIAAGAMVGVLIALTRPPSPGEKVIHHGKPVFNLLYPPEAMHVAKRHRGEYLRLEGRRGKLRVAVVARPLRLPAYRGDVTHGLLPVYADRYAEELRSRGFSLREEGRARVNNAVGYEIGVQAVSPGRRDYGRDVLLTSDDDDAPGVLVLSLRQSKAGGAKLTKPQKALAAISRKAYRSFRFGTERG
jgi:hypothetical protein